jgi:hypothetical protein
VSRRRHVTRLGASLDGEVSGGPALLRYVYVLVALGSFVRPLHRAPAMDESPKAVVT